MTARSLDVSWLCGEYTEYSYSFIYVRDAPEQVIARLGGRWEDFTPGPFPGDPDDLPFPGDPTGVASIGEWSFIVESGSLGTHEDTLTSLSKGTRVVSQFALSIKGLDYFYWCEDGAIRFGFWAQEGYLMDTPDELVDTMAEIDRLYPGLPDPHEGPAFLLAERLTGITLTRRLLAESTFHWGVVPEPPR
ncbi:DUF6461 domain-containing protein [Nonomuraea wenchangensis]